MAIVPFTKKILAGEPITLFGDGASRRDYTYVSDLVGGVMACVNQLLNDKTPAGRFEIYNIGSHRPVTLNELVAALEEAIGKKATIVRQPGQSGDVEQTFADLTKASAELGYAPQVSLTEGLRRTVAWVKHL